MRLFVSALLLALAPVAFAQTSPLAPFQPSGPDLSPQPQILIGPHGTPVQTGCPLTLLSAGLAPEAGYLPISPPPRQDGALDLRFRNSSGKVIASATLTAHLRAKTNIYALDASPVDFRLTFSGTRELDRDLDQLRHLRLPHHAYLFAVVRVSLDNVIFADGSLWSAKDSGTCAIAGGSSLPIEEP